MNALKIHAAVDMVPSALQASHVYQFILSPRMRQMLDMVSSFRFETRDSHRSCQLFQIFNKVRGSISNATFGQTVLQITTHGIRLDQHYGTSFLSDLLEDVRAELRRHPDSTRRVHDKGTIHTVHARI